MVVDRPSAAARATGDRRRLALADIVAPMQISAISQAPGASDEDTIAIGIFDGQAAPSQTPAEVGELLGSGEARSSFKALALTHADGKRWLLVGLGARA